VPVETSPQSFKSPTCLKPIRRPGVWSNCCTCWQKICCNAISFRASGDSSKSTIAVTTWQNLHRRVSGGRVAGGRDRASATTLKLPPFNQRKKMVNGRLCLGGQQIAVEGGVVCLCCRQPTGEEPQQQPMPPHLLLKEPTNGTSGSELVSGTTAARAALAAAKAVYDAPPKGAASAGPYLSTNLSKGQEFEQFLARNGDKNSPCPKIAANI
jgi:hypothetical protein